MMRDFVLNGFRSDLVAGAEYDQILDTPDDAPVAGFVCFPLIAGMKPAVAENFCCLVGLVPVAGKYARPANNNLIVVAQLHLDPRDGRSHASGHRMGGIVHGADAGGFGKTVYLKDGNAQHPEIVLSFWSQRGRTADQRPQVFANHLLADRRKHQPVGEPEPEPANGLRLLLLTRPRIFRTRVYRPCNPALLSELLIHATPHALQQLRYVQEIVWGDGRHVVGNLRQICIQCDAIATHHESQHGDPRRAKTEWQIVEDAILTRSAAHQLIESGRSAA